MLPRIFSSILVLCGFLGGIISSFQAKGNYKNNAIDCTKDSSTNFLIFFADDLGHGDLSGTFGHPTSSTPNLKELGKQSKVLTNFYVASPVCSPSRYFQIK